MSDAAAVVASLAFASVAAATIEWRIRHPRPVPRALGALVERHGHRSGARTAATGTLIVALVALGAVTATALAVGWWLAAPTVWRAAVGTVGTVPAGAWWLAGGSALLILVIGLSRPTPRRRRR